MDTLVFLAARPGKVVSAAELMAGVWAGRVVEEAAVYQTVAKLRRALDDDPHAPRFIETIPKKGYRLIARVGAARARAPSLPARAGLAIAGLSAIVLVGAGYNAWNGATRSDVEPEPAISIAVLPFVDMSADGTLAYLGDGIAEELIHQLSGREKLRVMARTSSFALRDEPAGVQRIGERLGVDAVLEGSVRRSADRVWVTAQLIDVADGFHVWSQKYERPLGDVFSIQADIAEHVTRSVASPQAADDAAAALYTPDPLAYERYLLGRHQMQLRRAESLRRAIAYLREAIATDPGFAEAQAALADALFLASERRYGDLDDAAALDEAGQVAAAALATDPECVVCLVATARLHTMAGRLDEAEAAVRRALTRRPADPEALAQLGDILDARGRPLDAIAVYERALERDPVSPRRQVRLAALNALNSRPEPAEHHYRLAIEIDPHWHVARYGGARFFRAYDRPTEALRWAYSAATVEAPGERFVAEAMQLMGEIWLDIGEPGLAEGWLLEAARHGAPSSDWELLDARIRVSLAGHQDGQARLLVPELVAAADETPELLWLAAMYHALLGNSAEAEALYDRAGSGTFAEAAPGWLIARGYLPALTREVIGPARVATAPLRRALTRARPGAGLTYLHAVLSHLDGDDDEALARLRAAVRGGWLHTWYMNRDPALRELRRDPGFGRILDELESRRAGFRAEVRRDPGYEALALARIPATDTGL